MNRIRWYGPTLVLLVTLIVVAVSGPNLARQIAWAQHDAEIGLIRNDLHDNMGLAQLSEAFRKVAEVVEPSVVSVEVLGRARQRGPERMPFPIPPGFEDLFPQQQQDQPRERGEEDFNRFDPNVPRGQGSGWVYDRQGHIVTNNHVVQGGDEIRVRFSNGREYAAEVVGRDPNTDVAVLKIDADDLHPLPVAGQDVAQGDIVFAFGSPFRFEFSMSQGIVSAKARQLQILGPGGYENFIQTDAAINPGNSGGPLTNIYGEAVGMNTAIASRGPMQQAGFMGLGFAIPVQMVAEVAEQLITTGEVQRGYLGIFIDDLDPQMARALGYDGEGVLVQDPIENGPADEAGLEPDDVITHVDDLPVRSADELRNMIARMTPGTTVELTIVREGETITVTTELGLLPTQADAGRPRTTPRDAERENASVQTLRNLGIEWLETFTPRHAEQGGAEHLEGVLVGRVRPNSIASTAGLVRGMVITQIMGDRVDAAESFLEELEKYEPGDSVRLRVAQWDPGERRWMRRSIAVELPGG